MKYYIWVNFGVMRYNICLFLVVLALNATGQSKYESFGNKITSKEVAPLDRLSKLSESDTLEMKISANVAEVCQAKGCWMTLNAVDGIPIRVTFKDYGFFVPKDIAGRNVIVNGKVSRTTLSEEAAKHYAEDAGQSYDPSKSYIEYAFVADGVLVSQE